MNIYEAIVIGSGPSGVIGAQKLIDNNINTLLIDAGFDVKESSPLTSNEKQESHNLVDGFHKNLLVQENFKTNPSSKYGKTKLLSENYIKKKFDKIQIRYCIGRIFSIFDNNQKGFFKPNLLKKIKQKSKKIIVNNMNHNRDFLSTKQISEIIFFLQKKNFTGTINIASGRKTNLRTIAKIFAKKAGKKIIFNSNSPTTLIANINKLEKLGFKQKKLNFGRYFN